MGRVYESVSVNGKAIHTIFDPGSTRSYIPEKMATKLELELYLAKPPLYVGLGGKKQSIKGYCKIEGRIERKFFHLIASVLDDIGKDERGREIELLFGAMDMQAWHIELDIKNERLELSHFKGELIEL